MSDGGERVYIERRAVDDDKAGRAWVQWLREAVTIVAAAGAAYMGIRVDLARNQLDIDNLKIQQAKNEAQIEKLREIREAFRNGNR